MRIQKPSDLARIVKTRRQSLGLTQQDIADAVGVTRQSLARIESGNGGASFDTVLRIFGQLDGRLEAVKSVRQLDQSTPGVDASALPPEKTGAREGAEIDAKAVRWALLSAAIEAGDPDLHLDGPAAPEERDLRDLSGHARNG